MPKNLPDHWWVIHDDLATALMIFGLVTFAKVKLHPPSSIMSSAIHRAMTQLIFVHEVGKLGGGNLGKLRGNLLVKSADQLVLWVF